MEDNYFFMLNRMLLFWYCEYWGQFHEDGVNTCIHCGGPAHQRWEKRYNGYIGFCTACDCTWPES